MNRLIMKPIEYRKVTSKYKSIIKLLSFNKLSMNRIGWNYRNLFKYMLFYLSKKSYFIKFLLFYEWLKLDSNYSNFIVNLKYCYSSVLHLIYISIINKNFSNRFKVLFLPFCTHSFFNFNNIHIFFFYHKFLYLYVNYNYATYLWLYGIKLTRTTFFYCSSLPTRKSIMVVLRSPHKDKRSREKFKLTKMSKNFCIPSFLYEKHFLYTFSNDSCLIKCLINVKKIK